MNKTGQIIIVCCLLMIGQTTMYSQNMNVYREMYDKTKAMVVTSYMGSNGNDTDNYGDGISYFLESSLVMYELTQDEKYIKEFVTISNEVMSYRDDFRHVNQQKPYWSTYSRNCYGPITYQTGLIIAPMAHFIYLSKKVYTQDFSASLTTPVVTFDNNVFYNYSDYAGWLYNKVKTTWNYYNQYYWISNRGYRQYADDPCYSASGDVDGMDRNCNWGVVNTYLALAFRDVPEGINYFDRAQTAAYQLRKSLREETHSSGVNYFQWRTEGWKNTTSYTIDDLSHAGAVIDFAYLCNQHKTVIKSAPGGGYPGGYFTDGDMVKFANTFIHKVYNAPLSYHNAIDGTCTFYLWPNCTKGDYVMPYGVARWIQLAQVADPTKYANTINLSYPIASDFISTFLEEPELTFSKTVSNPDGKYKRYGGSRGATILGISLAAANQGMFRFLGRNSTPGSGNGDDWQCVATGDFDNDGVKNEVVSIRNSDGGIFFWKILPNDRSHSENNMTVNYTNTGYRLASAGSVITGGTATGGSNSLWRGVTVGHFVDDIPGDQIAAVRESDGTLFIWKPVFNSSNGTFSLQTILTNNSSGSGNGWVGITSGDFDNDGVCEIAAIRNYDGGIYVWKVKKSGSTYYLQGIIANNSSGVNNQWAALSAGDLNNDGKDELVAVRNADGGIFVWKIVNNNGVYSLSTLVFDNTSGSGNKWNGMTIADFDADGVKELLLHRDSDGAFFVYNLNGSILNTKAITYLPVNQNNRVFSRGRLPNGQNDILVNCRNADGDIVLYGLDFTGNLNKINPVQEMESGRQFMQSGKEGYALYPNPSLKTITIVPENRGGNLSIQITNISGVQLYRNESYKSGTTIDIETLPGGIYLIQIKNESGEEETLKFTKQ